MAENSIIDVGMKKEALNVLVEKGILTEAEYHNCVKAIEKQKTDKGIFYKDKCIGVSYRGYEVQNMFGGKGIKIFIIVENKTPEVTSVRCRLSVNDVIVDNDHSISSQIPPKSKIIAEVVIFFDKLKVLDVSNVTDIESISFVFTTMNKQRQELAQAKKPAKIYLTA